MKIINARTGATQPIPFNLGEAGRGRVLEEVKVTNRPGQEPSGPEDVGYFTFGQERKHIILTKGNNTQRGILLRINTAGVYTKGSCGSVKLIGGSAELLTEGFWAEGDAGRVANGPDQLWHVKGPALFAVVLQGGEYKGMGHRYLIVMEKYRTVMIKRADLCQMIVTDSDPEVTATVRLFAETTLHDDVKSALKTADELEDSQSQMVEVTHFLPEWGGTAFDRLQGRKIAVPAAMGDNVPGVSEIKAGTLMPGSKQLVFLSMGPGGGKRYYFNSVAMNGLTVIDEVCERPYNRKDIIAIAEAPDWYVAWTDHKDGEVTNYYLANSGGVHSYGHDAQSTISTRAWTGINPVTPSEQEMCRIFGLELPVNQPKPQANNSRWGDDTVVTFRQPEPAREPLVTAPVQPAEPPKPLSGDEVRRQLAAAGIRIGRR